MDQPHFVRINQPSAFEFFDRFPDEDAARQFLIEARWPDGIICPRCGHDEIYTIRGGKLFKCKDKANCGKQFTVRLGTVMEDSPIPLRKWLFGMYLFGIHSKGVSSVMMAKQLGITQKSAWFMDHRMRKAFEFDGVMLDGTVEADEAYFGGKESNKHESKKLKQGRGAVGKQAVLGMRERGGSTVAVTVESNSADDLEDALTPYVVRGSRLYTDEHAGYNRLSSRYRHDKVRHGAGEYVRGDVHTNTIESAWALMKRSYVGIYHYWSHKHGHRYVAEIAGRLNIAGIPAFNPDEPHGRGLTMIRLMMAGMVGKRLTYAALKNG